jgi:hypothetical protein
VTCYEQRKGSIYFYYTELPVCKSEKLATQHGVPLGQRSILKNKKERKGKERNIFKKKNSLWKPMEIL